MALWGLAKLFKVLIVNDKMGQVSNLIDFFAGFVVIIGGALIMLSYVNLGIALATLGMFIEVVRYLVRYGVK